MPGDSASRDAVDEDALRGEMFFRLLANDRRRHLIAHLVETPHQSVGLSEVVAGVTARERNGDASTSDADLERVRASL